MAAERQHKQGFSLKSLGRWVLTRFTRLSLAVEKLDVSLKNTVCMVKNEFLSLSKLCFLQLTGFEHIENEILPALDKGKIVVSDRYIYSSLAYQGAAGLDLKWIKMINKHAIKPNIAIFIDVEPEIVLQRLRRKKSVMENLETQRKVRKVYMDFVDKGELVKIDGNKPKMKVAEAIFEAVSKAL